MKYALKYCFSLWGVPKTGQKISYYARDDGDLQKGWPKSVGRYLDNGDGTVTDNATGLMWPKDFGGAGGGNGAIFDWFSALDYANNITFAGYSDWRLPNANELSTLHDYNLTNPITDLIFENVVQFFYWSSTSEITVSSSKWALNFQYGETYNINLEYELNLILCRSH